MIDIDRYLLVRTASIYIGAVCLGAVWFWRRPSARAVAGAMLASVWNLPIVLALNVAAAHLGWWSFDARGGLLLGVPVDLYLVWVCVWGLVAALAFPSLSMFKLLLLVVGIDLVLMPSLLSVHHGWPARQRVCSSASCLARCWHAGRHATNVSSAARYSRSSHSADWFRAAGRRHRRIRQRVVQSALASGLADQPDRPGASWAWKPWRAPSSTFTVDGRCSDS